MNGWGYQEQQVSMCASKPWYIQCHFPIVHFVEPNTKVSLTTQNEKDENPHV